MVGIGILGYGTVGSGVYEVLDVNKDIIERKTGEKIKVKKYLIYAIFRGIMLRVFLLMTLKIY